MDAAIAQRYGTGAQAAVYQAAYIIPTVLIGMFSGGAILGAFVPTFIRLGGQQRQPEAEVFLKSTAGLVLAVLIPLVVMLMGATPQLVAAVASGFDSTGRNQVEQTLRLMLSMLFLHGIAYVYCSALVSIGRVGLANLAPLLIPLAGLATYPWWAAQNGAELIAIGYVLGTLLMAVGLGFRLRLDGFRVLPTRPGRSPEWKSFLNTYAISSLAYAALSALLLVNQAFAGSLSSRDLATFSYGVKLVLLALAFFTVIVNSVALPHFSSMTGRLDHAGIWRYARVFLFQAFIVASLAAMLWMFFAGRIVDAVYARGEFTAADAELVADVQRIFVLQVPFYVVGIFCWRMLNALDNWKPLLAASLVALSLNLTAVLYLKLNYGVSGIAAAHTMSVAIWALILFFSLRAQLVVARLRHCDPS